MRYALVGVLGLGLIAVGHSASAVSCGALPGDTTAVAALELDVAGACDCCAFRDASGARRCAVPLAKRAVLDGRVTRRCARRVLRDTLRACAIVRAAAAPCRVCNGDGDCAANEFCECRPGSCDKIGGVCVAKPEVCDTIDDPVCGCDGTPYPNDCARRMAGACRLSPGACGGIAGGCFDTIGFACTGESCGPGQPCPAFNEFCTPSCVPPPPEGECFSTLDRKCTGRTCGAAAPCFPNELCVPECPPSATTTTLPGGSCANDPDCDDGNPCTHDACVDGTCEHACLCVSPVAGVLTCCPGPATECPPPTTTTTLPSPCDPASCRYYLTCGYPVCSTEPASIPGVPPCTTQKDGEPCTTRFDTCDPGVGCGVRLLCTDHDPAVICPISRRAAKEDVSYLNDTDLDRLLGDIRRLRLATYRYKGEQVAGGAHLGFIIDDVGTSPAIAPDGGHVDLYGYTSMAVAAIQAQQKRIDALEHQVRTLEQRCLRGR